MSESNSPSPKGTGGHPWWFVAQFTAGYSLAVMASGVYRYFGEPGGANGLWFGVVMGGTGLLAATLQAGGRRFGGNGLAILVALLVGGWFAWENFVQQKHQVRMYLMIGLSLGELAVVALAGWSQRWPGDGDAVDRTDRPGL